MLPGEHDLTCVPAAGVQRTACRAEELVGRGSDKLSCGGRRSLVAANAGLRGESCGYWESP